MIAHSSSSTNQNKSKYKSNSVWEFPKYETKREKLTTEFSIKKKKLTTDMNLTNKTVETNQNLKPMLKDV